MPTHAKILSTIGSIEREKRIETLAVVKMGIPAFRST
jgi:hypothetical protein